ncbi:MAG: glycosyltransferase [Fervidobacterium sp.]|nr:glycosyltransferase [Fervidobacterium sp.]
MKILILTNFFPYKNNPVRGIFVSKRIEQYKNFNLEFKVLGISYKETKLLRFTKELLKIPLLEPLEYFDNLKYEYITVKRGIISVIFHRLNNIDLMVNQCKKIADLLLFETHNLIHAHGMSLPIPAGLVARELSKKLNVPYLITLHGSEVNYQMKREKVKKLYISVLEEASKVIFVSNRLLETAKSYGYSGKNSVIIPNGFDSDIFFPRNKDEVRQELNIFIPKTKYVGYVGGLKYVKRADKLPEIFYQIATKIPETKFIIVGDGELRKLVQKKISKLGLNVLFTGRIPQTEVAKYMSAMDVMILPSRNEGFGTVCLEAQACGTCVIGSSNGGIPEAIGFDEFVVIDGKNFEKRFAEKVVEVLLHEYDSNLFVNRAKFYNWENLIRKEIQIYRDVTQDT